ncbi:MAG: Asp-tRNA(Asn)/Glu-tRNA(Gln) amidotransferase subunit GatA [Bacillota bacterium]
MKLWELTAHQLAAAICRGETSAAEATEAYLERIQAVEGQIEAYLTITADLAREQARQVDARLSRGEQVGPLAGVPMALKDILCTEGVRTTAASRMLENFVPPYDATATARLRASGAVLLGKTNLDEFAMGSSVENSAYKQTYNPWDTSRVPGGSSGGSAAAVAAGEAAFSLGTETGGSIRHPASFCGIVGLKPTYGLVSRYGLVHFASSLDQIGPMTRDVRDCALVLQAIAGHDPLDSTTYQGQLPDYLAGLEEGVEGLRLGVAREYFGEGLDPRVGEAVRRAIGDLERQGAVVEEVSLPHSPYALAVYYTINPSEASSNLARYDGIGYGHRTAEATDLEELYRRSRSEGFGDEVIRRIMIGTYALSSGYYDAYYLKAQKVRTLIKRDFDQAFSQYDAIIGPVTPTVAFRVGEMEDPLAMYLSDIYLAPVNLAGIPAVSVPCGFVDGLPVGLQIIGPALSEARLLRIARAYERSHDYVRLPQLEVKDNG